MQREMCEVAKRHTLHSNDPDHHNYELNHLWFRDITETSDDS